MRSTTNERLQQCHAFGTFDSDRAWLERVKAEQESWEQETANMLPAVYFTGFMLAFIVGGCIYKYFTA